LVDREITIEEDNFEEGLTSTLIAAGINAENIHTNSEDRILNQRGYISG
jgi:hypothetical protein